MAVWVGTMIDPLLLAADRDAFVMALPDTATIKRKTRTASPTQPGRFVITTAVVAVVPCKVFDAPTLQQRTGGQITAVADYGIRLPANTDIRNSDTLEVVATETQETKTFEVMQVRKKTGELARVAMVRDIGPDVS